MKNNKNTQIEKLKRQSKKLNNRLNQVGDVIYDDMFCRICKVDDFFNKDTKKLLKNKFE